MIDHPAVARPPWPRSADTSDLVQPVTRPAADEPAVCPDCGRTLAWLATRPWKIRCRHCKVDVDSPG